MESSGEIHTPVLAREIVQWLQPVSGKTYIDGTLGLGGHSGLILEASSPTGRVFGFEWDQDAACLAAARLSPFGDRFQLVQGSYAELLNLCYERGVEAIDGILVDLGVSSLQLDRPERGFSFMNDASLDMRMDTSSGVTAAQLVNTLPEQQLADILYNYGEERQARRIARFIIQARLEESLTSTGQLAQLVARAIPVKYHPKKIHVATKVFQALRVAVNREFDNLVQLLDDAPELLTTGARIAIISFHSLEDRIVKQAFKNNPAYQALTRKPVTATEQEINDNPRARSAKLRVAEKV